MTDHLDDDLVALLDEQAKSLLQRAKDDASLSGEERLSVQDQVRVFTAVTNYVEARLKIAPPEKGKSRIAQLSEKLNEPPKPRRERVNGTAGGREAGGGGLAPQAPPPIDEPPPPI